MHPEDNSYYIYIFAQMVPFSFSFFVCLYTLFDIMFVENKQTKLKTYKQNLIFLMLIFFCVYCSTYLQGIYYVNFCEVSTYLRLFSIHFILVSLMLICNLLWLGISKNDSYYRRFKIISIVSYMILFIQEISIFYIGGIVVEKKPEFYRCQNQIKYQSFYINFSYRIVPLITAQIYTVFTFVKGRQFLQQFPETNTKELIRELKWYPIITSIFVLPKITQVLLFLINIEPLESFKVYQTFLKGISGSLVCVVLFIRRKRFMEIQQRKTKDSYQTEIDDKEKCEQNLQFIV